MAFLGNKRGPKESELVQSLGHEYFGITPAKLTSDVEMYEESERRGEVQPVRVDASDRPYIILSRPGGGDSFYLEERGWVPDRNIETETEEDKKNWHRRLEAQEQR